MIQFGLEQNTKATVENDMIRVQRQLWETSVAVYNLVEKVLVNCKQITSVVSLDMIKAQRMILETSSPLIIGLMMKKYSLVKLEYKSRCAHDQGSKIDNRDQHGLSLKC